MSRQPVGTPSTGDDIAHAPVVVVAVAAREKTDVVPMADRPEVEAGDDGRGGLAHGAVEAHEGVRRDDDVMLRGGRAIPCPWRLRRQQ